MKNLAAFDFDHTIIYDNSDTVIASLIPGGIPTNIKKLQKNNGWTAFMQGVFDELYDNGIMKDKILENIINLKPIDGIIELIENLQKEYNYDVIIISDSNSYFINNWLLHQGLEKYVLKVFTNPAEFVDDKLKIQKYHVQEYCDLSSDNLCKGQILIDFIEQQKTNNVYYDHVIYCGDGANDFCPILKLNISDFAFARENFKCIDLIKKSEQEKTKDKFGNPLTVKAKIHIWQNGYDILEQIRIIHTSNK